MRSAGLSRDIAPLARLSTGSEALDQILGGGLVSRSINLIAGEPGSGKTILALQTLFHLARQGKRSLYFTTLSEPSIKLIGYMQHFTFFDPELLEECVRFVDLGGSLRGGDPERVLDVITERVERDEPAIVVIDSFKVIGDLLRHKSRARAFAYDLAVHMAGWGATTMLLGEYTIADFSTRPEFAIADGILRLSSRRMEHVPAREIEVLKLRGSRYEPGMHPFEIDHGGAVFSVRGRGASRRESVAVRGLYDIAHSFESAENADARIQHALTLLAEIVSYERCALADVRAGGEYSVVFAPDPAPEGPEREALMTMLRRLSALLCEQPERTSISGDGSEARGSGAAWGAHLAVPLVGLDEVIGCLLVVRPGPIYSEVELSHLSIVAAQIASYMTAIRLHDGLSERAVALERAKQAAEAASRAKDDFVATVSHELRTPLSAVIGWIDMIRSGSLPEEGRARALDTVARNAAALVRLVDDLLDASRIATGKLRVDRHLIELGPVVKGAAEAARPQAEGKAIRFYCSIDPSPAIVDGDTERLRQVVSNLLANAIKFTPSGGSIEVRLDTTKTSARISVKDTGRGISPDLLPHIFDHLRQGDARSRRGQDGLGLGLSIVRRIVELHDGWVGVESGGDGAGATFTVEIPLAERADR